MNKIRKLYWFDKKKIQEMISFLNDYSYDTYINHITFNPLLLFHHFLPLKFKFLPESFVLQEDKTIKGMITVTPQKNKYKKMEIQKLFFEENSLSIASDLVQYVVSKYKAMGAFSILVKVNDYLPKLLTLLVSKCGFSQISYEKLWRINKFPEENFDKKDFRNFNNTDAQAITNIYNDSLLPHFRPLLSKEAQEYKEPLFKGLSYYSEYKYIIEDKRTKSIIGYILIQTYDNENFIIDISQTAWINLDINSILSFAIYQIKKRKKRFGVFVKTKRYTLLGESYENVFKKNGYECVQNQILLTNSSANVLKETVNNGKYTIISDFLPANPVATHFMSE